MGLYYLEAVHAPFLEEGRKKIKKKEGDYVYIQTPSLVTINIFVYFEMRSDLSLQHVKYPCT